MIRRSLILAAAITLLVLPAMATAAPGDLDTTFNDPDGYARYNNYQVDVGEAIAVQADGKIVGVGFIYNGSDDDVMVFRAYPEGNPDPSFGTGGYVFWDSRPPVPVKASANYYDGAWAVAVQQDGKIVVAGRTNLNLDGYDELLVLRLNTDGTLDDTFAAGGVFVYDSTTGSDSAHGVALQEDGKIVVTGETYNGSDNDALVIRLNADGTLDDGFGTGGVFILDTSPVPAPGRPITLHYEYVRGIVIQEDGKIVSVGSVYDNLNYKNDVILLRLASDGSLDDTFGTGGIVIYDTATQAPAPGRPSVDYDDQGEALALLPDGRIAVAGDTGQSGNYNSLVMRFNTIGQLEFVAWHLNPDSTSNYARAVAVQPDGKIITAGQIYDSPATMYKVKLMRYATDGQPDSTFGTGGVVTFAVPSSLSNYAYGMARQADGKIVIIGQTNVPTPAPTRLAAGDVLIARFEAEAFDKIDVVVPNGGEEVASGGEFAVGWGSDEAVDKVKLFYSLKNGKAGTWKLISKGLTDTMYTWSVPKTNGNKRNCRIKTVGLDGGIKLWADKSDERFSIEVIKVLSPNGGELLPGGNDVTVAWRTNGTKGKVAKAKIYLTKNGGRTWVLMGKDPDNSGSFDITMPVTGAEKTQCKVKVVLKNARGRTIGKDASDGWFTIMSLPPP